MSRIGDSKGSVAGEESSIFTPGSTETCVFGKTPRTATRRRVSSETGRLVSLPAAPAHSTAAIQLAESLLKNEEGTLTAYLRAQKPGGGGVVGERRASRKLGLKVRLGIPPKSPQNSGETRFSRV